MMSSPMLEKMRSVNTESNAIGEFLDWLTSEKKVELCQYSKREQLVPFHYTIEQLLADYFEIDLQQAEAERKSILAKLKQGTP